jgi:hypothetical protein
MRPGKESFPVKVENSPSVTLTKLSTAALQMSDKVITCIPGSSNDTATPYLAWTIEWPLLSRHPPAQSQASP